MIINCPFCNIDEEPERIISRRKKVTVVFFNSRLLPGHILVFPKRHVEKISELNQTERTELFNTVIEYQQKIIDTFDGCDMRQNYRPFATQSNVKVDHVHIHLLPRKPDDVLKEVLKHEKKMWTALVPSERKKFIDLFSK